MAGTRWREVTDQARPRTADFFEPLRTHWTPSYLRLVGGPERQVKLDRGGFLRSAPAQDRLVAGGEAHHPAVLVEEDSALAAGGVDDQVSQGGHGVGLDGGGVERVRLLHEGRIGTNLPRLKPRARIPFVIGRAALGEGAQAFPGFGAGERREEHAGIGRERLELVHALLEEAAGLRAG